MAISADMELEKRISTVLFEYIAPALRERGINISQVNDRFLDYKGIDAIVNGEPADIKAHQLPPGRKPNAYAFERSSRMHRDGILQPEIVDGWLVSRKKRTRSYLIVYYRKNGHEEITDLYMVYVDREKVLDLIEKEGIDPFWDDEELKNEASKITVLPNNAVKYYYGDKKAVSVTVSRQLPECPTNFVVRHESIIGISEWHYHIIFDNPVPITNTPK